MVFYLFIFLDDNILPLFVFASPQVVCQVCSSNKCRLAYLKNQPARVCDQCFETLLRQRSRSGRSVLLKHVFTLKLFHLKQLSWKDKSRSRRFLNVSPSSLWFCSLGAINSAVVTPGNKASFAFSRRQKRIPSALKEVQNALFPF